MSFFATIDRLKNTPLPADIPCKFVQENSNGLGISRGPAVSPRPAILPHSEGLNTPPAGGAHQATEHPARPEPPVTLDDPTEQAPEYTAPAKNLHENRENFAAAWPWLQANLAALLAAGWTRASLFQRGKGRYPAGRWGIAWLDVWRREGLSVTIGRGGQVVYRFEISNRIITQTSSTYLM